MLRGLIVAAGLLLPAHSFAADQCKDVLAEKVMDSTTIQVGREIQLSSLSRLTSRQTKTDEIRTAAKFPIKGVPVEGVGDWVKTRTADLTNNVDVDLLLREQGSLVLQSGQAEIVKAWRDCMLERRGGGGVGTYFSSVGDGSKQVFFHIDYLRRPQGDGSVQEALRLVDDVYLDEGVRAVSNRDCFAKGFVIKAGENCVVQLIVPSAWTTLPIVLSFQSESKARVTVVDTLLPRVTPVVETRAVSFKVPGSVPPDPRSYTYSIHSQENLPICQTAPKGYTFAGKGKVLTTARGASIANESCKHDLVLNESGDQICIHSRFVNTPGKSDYYCDWQVDAVAARLTWSPARP